jgi:hypothetical protein
VGEKVAACIDKNEQLQGTKIHFADREIAVLSAEELRKIKGKNFVLLITNADYHGADCLKTS